MTRIAAGSVMAMGLGLSLLGCTQMSESGYSDRYRPLMSATETDVRYLPQACLAPDMIGTQARLPPGCANALNLAEMVVDQKDLGRGREMGPALVAPAAAAVERYLGVRDDDNEERRERLERESNIAN